MFAERLKEARKAKRYSQAEVSRMLGVTQQAVGKWETGRSTPDPQTVARLAEILDTPTDVLLGLRKESGAASAVGRNAFSRYTESQIPVVGTVRAGYGALAFEEDYGKEYACVKDPASYWLITQCSFGSRMAMLTLPSGWVVLSKYTSRIAPMTLSREDCALMKLPRL